MLAFYDMMKKQIVMPAHLMDDGEHREKTGRNLFKDFSSVAQSTGTYTGYVSPEEETCPHTFQCLIAKSGLKIPYFRLCLFTFDLAKIC